MKKNYAKMFQDPNGFRRYQKRKAMGIVKNFMPDVLDWSVVQEKYKLYG